MENLASHAVRPSRECSGHLEELGDPRLGQTVEDPLGVSPVDDQPGLAQLRELLGDVGLRSIQQSRQVTDAFLALAEGLEDDQADRVGQRPEELGLAVQRIDLGNRHDSVPLPTYPKGRICHRRYVLYSLAGVRQEGDLAEGVTRAADHLFAAVSVDLQRPDTARMFKSFRS